MDYFDGVVPVAEPVPEGDLRLHVSGRVGCPGAEGVPSHVGGVPVEGPVLPVMGAAGRLELRLVPIALAGQADLHPRDRPGPRPRFAAHGADAGVYDRRRSGIGDPRTHAHQVHRLGRSIWPLVPVVTGLELAGVRLGQDVDARSEERWVREEGRSWWVPYH